MSLLAKHQLEMCRRFLYMLAKTISSQIDEKIDGDKVYEIKLTGATIANLMRAVRRAYE